MMTDAEFDLWFDANIAAWIADAKFRVELDALYTDLGGEA